MIRRLVGVLLAASTLFALVAGGASAEAPAGPRLTFLRWDASQLGLFSADPAGADQRLIAGGGHKARPLPYPFSPPAWSGDGTRVAFTGVSPGKDDPRLDIYVAMADGSGLERVPGTRDGFYPVLSPDGQTLAFARKRERQASRPRRGEVTVFESIAIWLLDLRTGVVRQLTPWRNGLHQYPSSFSPDSSTLAISRDQRRHSRPTLRSALSLRLDGSASTVLARHAADPVYSPDGMKLALISTGATRTFESSDGKTTITSTEIAIANADGSGLTKLTHTSAVELEPSWDPSGRRLAYTQLPADGGKSELGFGDSIMEINADGTCRTRVLTYPKALLFGATWQPGLGREAGPMLC
ncbi:MAG TPA: hypothetical protein VFX35_03975 [Solirubrobacterales bacterium]|nr:hypothetical protein [Solirubrobacterales bacterium]